MRLVRLDASEALSKPFLIVIEALSTLGEVDLLPHLGKPAMVESRVDGESQRFFHGIITDGYFVDEIHEEGHLYRLTLMPQAHFHEQSRNFRIYQDMTVIDTVKNVLEYCKIDFDVTISGGNRTRSYCVQYGESDFSFVCRLLEEDGLYYYYRHEADKHVMVICDEPASHQALSIPALQFNPTAHSVANVGSGARSAASSTSYYLQSWHEHVSSGAEGRVTMRDFDFMAPTKAREANATDESMHPGDEIEIYDWPGRYYKESEGKELSNYVLESRRAQRIRYDGATGYSGMTTGSTFTVSQHPLDRLNREYMIIACHTSLSAEVYRSSMGGGSNQCRFTAIPDDVQFRAPIVTPRPIARGPETAIVTGPPGEEIYVDKYGRIKVHFHWDREGGLDENSSCWIRVSQTGGLGNIIIPRVKHEVLVDFINGDPDRPIVVGRVFNASYMPVYNLPDNKTRAVWRTKTYQRDSGTPIAGNKALDTGTPGANEIRFEDKTGDEELFIHAEKDLNTRIANCETHCVGGNQCIDIGIDRTETVGQNESVTIAVNRTKSVGSDESSTIGANRTERVGASEEVAVGANRKLTIGDNEERTIGKNSTMNVGNSLKITAGQEIKLVVGTSSITIGPAKIEIKSTLITVEATAKTTVKGAMVDVAATAINSITGLPVKIN